MVGSPQNDEKVQCMNAELGVAECLERQLDNLFPTHHITVTEHKQQYYPIRQFRGIRYKFGGIECNRVPYKKMNTQEAE